jgi:hypothetical protein
MDKYNNLEWRNTPKKFDASKKTERDLIDNPVLNFSPEGKNKWVTNQLWRL